MFICTMLRGAGLLDVRVRETLFQTAVHMYTRSEYEASFRTPWCEGRVTTEFRTGVIGSYGGPLFTAEAEHENGKSIVHFFVDTDLLSEADLSFNPDCWMDSGRDDEVVEAAIANANLN